jgi:hypothetical protein
MDINTRVSSYQKDLLEYAAFLRQSHYDLKELLGNKQFIEKVEAAIEREISFCNFFWHLQKMKTKPGYREWVLHSGNDAKAKDIAKGESWTNGAAYNDRWIRFDGRTAATIEVDKSGVMTKLSLYVDNERQLNFKAGDVEACNLKFVSGREELDVAHLKNEAAIEDRIREMKNHGIDFQNRHEYPLYMDERGDMEALDELLQVK